MLKKIKKYKLSLFLLAVVAMLSVYYILMPEKNPVDKPVGNLEDNTVSRYAEFAEARLTVTDQRNEEVADYQEKIVAANATMVEINGYVEEISNITSLTEKEVSLESNIISLGYDDCLAILDDTGKLNISILSDNFDKKQYIKVAKVALQSFGDDTKVAVKAISKEVKE